MRNLVMAERIGAAAVRYPFSFVVAGDSGAWPDPTADAIIAQLLEQTARLRPAPVFFANLGDFAGPGTRERHEHYLRMADALPVPNVCVVGNHDLDDPGGPEAWAQVHGPVNFQFAHGHTRFIAIDAAPGEVGEIVVDRPDGTAGPGDDALAYLAHALEAAAEPHTVVLMHAPPSFGGRFAPHPEWGFNLREPEFLELVRRHGVDLVCCAHAPAVRPPRPRRHPLRRLGRRRHRALLALPRHLRRWRRAPRGPRSALPRRRDHRHRGGRGLRPRAAGLRPRRRPRAPALRRPVALRA